MALRSGPALTVAITGPRSRAVGAPQWIGKWDTAPAPGWEVRRMCVLRFMNVRGKAPPKTKASRTVLPARGLQTVNVVAMRHLGKGTGRRRLRASSDGRRH